MFPLGPLRSPSYLEFNGIDELATLVTLVTSGLLVATEGTHSLHEAVGQEARTLLAPQLLHGVFQHKTPRQQALEDVLGDPGQVRERGEERGRGAGPSPSAALSRHPGSRPPRTQAASPYTAQGALGSPAALRTAQELTWADFVYRSVLWFGFHLALRQLSQGQH